MVLNTDFHGNRNTHGDLLVLHMYLISAIYHAPYEEHFAI